MAKTMLDEIVGMAPHGAVEMLTHFKDVNAPALHSFVHGGIHAIQRGLTGYPVELLANVVRSSNGLYTMAGMLLAILSGDETLAKRMSKIQPRFADCLPPLVAPTVRGRYVMCGARQPAAGTDLMAQSVVRSRHLLQPRFLMYPHVYQPATAIPETQHPCAFPPDLPEQVQNIE
jgi:hypothetical protein